MGIKLFCNFPKISLANNFNKLKKTPFLVRNRKETSGEVTRVDESEEESEDAGGQNTGAEEEVEETEEEEEEEVVSGNILAKRKNKPPRTSNDNSKEMPSMLASTVIQVTHSVLDPVVNSVGSTCCGESRIQCHLLVSIIDHQPFFR